MEVVQAATTFTIMVLFWLFIILLPIIVIGVALYLVLKSRNKDDEGNKFNFTLKDIFTWAFVLFMIFAFVVGAFMMGAEVAEKYYEKNIEKKFITTGVAIVVGVILCVIGLLMRKNKPLFIGFFTPLLLIMAISGIILWTDGFFLLLISGIIAAIIVYFRDKVFAC